MQIGMALETSGRQLLWRALDDGLTAVGSNPECDLCIPDEAVAPIQFVLRREGTALTLINRNSDGTRVGGETVTGETRLADGDTITMGPLVATVCFKENGGSSRVRTRTLPTTSAAARTQRLCVAAPLAHPGQLWEIDEAGVSIGSDPGNDVVLADPYVSAFHVRVVLEQGRVIVRDLGSRNGVFVNDHKVTSGEVTPGAQVRLGRSVLTVMPPEGMASTSGPATHASPAHKLIGRSVVMDKVRERLARVAASDAPVLITGETGTGKEVVARLCAALSPRAAAPMMALNCGALQQSLIESELFGHEKGAFTGAIGRKTGAFEAADGGTLFLDEIGELPLDLQPKLLRVIESGEVRRVGAVDTFKVNVRLLAATNRCLEQEVARGVFREDLYHRLHVLVLELPSLRERREDIAELAQHFMKEFAPPGEHLALAPEAATKLLEHDWPGNVRELRNVIQRAVLMRSSSTLGTSDITFAASTLNLRVQAQSATRQRTLQELEREAIIAELVRYKGSKTEAAAALGLSRSTIHRKIDEYGIDVPALLAGKGH